MRKITLFILALSVLLSACVAAEAPSTAPVTVPSTEASTEAATIPTTEAVTLPSTEATDPPVLHRHPLTGAPLDAPFTGRPVAVVTNNHQSALPHHGVSGADILCEILAEGGITRFLAIYTDLKDVGSMGSIRSARTYFISLARSFDSILVHHGQSGYAGDLFSASGSDHINGGAPYFFRDQNRLNTGYAYEHTLFTTGEKLLQNIEKAGLRLTAKEDIRYGLSFSEDAAIEGTDASTVAVKYGIGGKTNTLRYDDAAGQYTLTQFGTTYIDGNTGKEVTFSNVLVLFADCRTTGTSHVFHTLTGENRGYLLQGGQMAPIRWHREHEAAPFTYTLEDGSPILLKPGKTYIAVVPANSTVTPK